MNITQLSCTNFRHLQTQSIDFHPRINFIYGMNGSGKTALLEALYTLGRGKSFRESNIRNIITHQENFFRLVSILTNKQGKIYRLGMERYHDHYTLRLNGENINGFSALAHILPVQILDSYYFSLIDDGPHFRRRFIDYGLFYYNQNFLSTWQYYQYALKNRNAALRQQWANHLIIPWHSLMEQYAAEIDTLRRQYLTQLSSRLNYYHAQLGGMETIEFRYYSGWPQDISLAERLTAHLARDRGLKQTRDGIHRAEWRMFVDGQDVAHIFSRGQQKTLLCALLLAQSDLITQKTGIAPVILIDDISAELDKKRHELLIKFLLTTTSQLFITSINEPQKNFSDAYYFHIENGKII